MSIRATLTVSLAACLLSTLTARTHGDDWPQWLGPKRDGVWRESGIVDEIPKGGPKVRWRREIGGGYAGPSVANGRVFVADRVVQKDDEVARPEKTDPWTRVKLPGKERLLCLRESDGKLLWSHEYECEYTNAYDYANGPRVTPTVSGGKVYALGAEGHLFCFDEKTGRIIWQTDFRKRFSLETPVWGWASAPLVDVQKLICIVGGKGSTAVAFDKDDGKEIWRSLDSKEPGYSAPVIYEVGGRRQLLIWHGEAINGLDPETGKPFWSVPTKAFSGMSCATPVVDDHHLYLMAYQNWSMMLKLDESKPAAEVLWNGHGKLGIAGAINTAVLRDGHIYADGSSGRYTCAEMSTGKWKWTTYQPSTGGRPQRWATVFTVPIENGGKPNRYVLSNDQGEISFATLTPAGYEETSRAKIIEPSQKVWNRPLVWSHPAFANRSVYQRSDKEIVCVSLAADD